jgi:hypothetical protein
LRAKSTLKQARGNQIYADPSSGLLRQGFQDPLSYFTTLKNVSLKVDAPLRRADCIELSAVEFLTIRQHLDCA